MKRLKQFFSLILLLTIFMGIITPEYNASDIEVNDEVVTENSTDQQKQEESTDSLVPEENNTSSEEETNTQNDDTETNESNAPPKEEEPEESQSDVAETLDEFVVSNDSDTNSIEYQIVTPDVLTQVQSAGDTFNVTKLGTYSGDLNEFGVYAYGELVMYKINGQYVFCIEFGKDVTNISQETYQKQSLYNTFSADVQKQIQVISAYASSKYIETNNINYLYAGQIMVWKAINPDQWNVRDTGSSIQPQMDELVGLKNDHFDIPSYTSSTQAGAPTFTLNYNTSTKQYEAILTDTNGVSTDKSDKLIGTWGDYTVTRNGSTTLKVTTKNGKAPTVNAGGAYIPYGNGYNTFYDSGQDMISGSTDPLYMNVNFAVKEATGSVRVLKTGETTENGSNKKVVLENAGFQVQQNGVMIQAKLTDSSGYVKFDNLPIGTYQLVETKTPAGYNTAKPTTITVTANGVTNIEIFNDVVDTDINLLKVDSSDNHVLSGAEFEFYRVGSDKPEVLFVGSNGEKITSVTTGEDGTAIIPDFKFGNYTAVEVKAPEGYNLDETPIPFSVTKENQTIELKIENDIIDSDIDVLKTDSETGEVIANTEFGVFTLTLKDDVDKSIEGYEKDINNYSMSTEPIEVNSTKRITDNPSVQASIEIATEPEQTIGTSAFTDEDGVINLRDITYGTYALVEINPAEGYVMSEDAHIFSVTTEGEIIEINVENTKIKNTVIITKEDTDSGEEIPGAEICVNDAAGEEIECFTSTEEAHEVVIDYGYDYEICETLAPDGYVQETNCINFDVTTDGVTQEHTLLNEKIKSGEITLTKTDWLTKEKLSGAEFELLVKNDDGNYVAYEQAGKTNFITGKDGTLVLSEVVYGEYALREIKAPNGYVVSDTLIPFTVNEDGVDIELEFDNQTEAQITITGIATHSLVIVGLLVIIVLSVIYKKKHTL